MSFVLSIMKLSCLSQTATPQPTSYFDYTLSFVGSQLVFRCSSVLFLYSSDQDHAEQFRCIILLFIALPLRLKTEHRHSYPLQIMSNLYFSFASQNSSLLVLRATVPNNAFPLQITSILYSSIAPQFHDIHFHCVSMQCNSFSVPH